MTGYSVLHYALEHGLEPWSLLGRILDTEEYGIGPKVIVDPLGNRWHDEYHDIHAIEDAAAVLRQEEAR